MSVIEVLLDPLSHLIIGNGNEAANVARIIAHNSTVNFKNVHLMRFPCAAFLEVYLMEGKPTICIIVKHAKSDRRDQRVVCFAPQAARRPVAPSTTPVPLRKPRARHERAFAIGRMSGGLPSAARRRGVALRLRFARRFPPPSAPLSPLADRRPKPESEPIMD